MRAGLGGGFVSPLLFELSHVVVGQAHHPVVAQNSDEVVQVDAGAFEMAGLMIASSNYSASYAKCLLAATPQDQMVQQDKPKAVPGLSAEDMARMEREMETLSRDFRLIEESYGRSVLNLVIAVGYLRKLLNNAAVLRYLSKHFAEILAEFQKILEAATLEGSA